MPKTEPPSFRTPFTVESYRSYLQCERKRNLLVDKDRGGRKKRERGEKGANWSKERERGKRKKDDGAMGPPPKPSLSPTNFSPATSRLDETRSSHVTLNWSIIWQSSCPNRRHSQSIRDYPCQTIAKVSSSIGRAIFQKYSVLLPIESNDDWLYI